MLLKKIFKTFCQNNTDKIKALSKHYEVLQSTEEQPLGLISKRYINIRQSLTNLAPTRRKVRQNNLRQSFKQILRIKLRSQIHISELEEQVQRYISQRQTRPELYKLFKDQNQEIAPKVTNKLKRYFVVGIAASFVLNAFISYYFEI